MADLIRATCQDESREKAVALLWLIVALTVVT
jgi:hypothetical protein